MSGIANQSFGDLITSDYTFSWTQSIPSVNPGTSYGDPIIAGNTIDFSSPNFFANTIGSNNVALTEGTLNLTIMANPDKNIVGLTVNESGIYAFGPIVDPVTGVYVNAFANVTITQLNGNENVLIPTTSYPMNFSALPVGSLTAYKGGNPGPDPNVAYQGSMPINNLSSFLSGSNTGKTVTGIKLSFDNSLASWTGNTLYSKINTQDVNINVSGVVVPEPASLVLLGMGALLFIFVRKR
jgi:hypothetical protein